MHLSIWLQAYYNLKKNMSAHFLATDPEAWVRFPALPGKKISGSGTGSNQPREYN
jgi:hypothetical protein